MPGFAECGPDKTAGDCIVCAGVLSYLALGVRQSLTVRDIISVLWNTGRDWISPIAASLDLRVRCRTTSESFDS